MINKKRYRAFCKKENKIPIFSKDWWLDSVCGYDNWDVVIIEKGGNIFATMPYYIEKKYGLTIIKHPKLTQTSGIYFKYPKNQKYYKKLSFEKEMINKIIAQLPKFDKFTQSFNYKYTNLLPFYWNNFSLNIKYTYIIEDLSLENLQKNLETDIRRRRKKASESGIIVYQSNDVEKLYELNKMTFERQKENIPYSLDFVKNLFYTCQKHNACKIFFAKDNEGEILATSFLVYDEDTVYYLMGGIHPEKRNLGGMDVIQYESIKFALTSNRIFNFEGSMIESIEKYFRSFGAIQQPYYNISKINSKLLKLQTLLK